MYTHHHLTPDYAQSLLREGIAALWRHRHAPDSYNRPVIRRWIRWRIDSLRAHRRLYGTYPLAPLHALA